MIIKRPCVFCIVYVMPTYIAAFNKLQSYSIHITKTFITVKRKMQLANQLTKIVIVYTCILSMHFNQVDEDFVCIRYKKKINTMLKIVL